jgi:internalin A
MRRLAAGDLVFVIVSDKYLRSPFCMYELHEIWRNCRQDAGELHDRIRVFRLPGAAFQTPIERLKRAAFWQKEFQDLDAAGRDLGFSLLGQDDFHRYKCMKDFALHVGDILATVADMVLPATIDELARWGFDE